MIAAKESGTSPGDDVVIECQEVRKTYKTGKIAVEALRGVDLRVHRGEVVAVMGPSGCGKTTLLNCLSGLDDVSTGSVRIEGKEIARMNDNQRSDFRALRMGFVFQNYNLMPVLTAVENVELPLLLTGNSRAESRKRAHESLKVMGLEGRESHRPAELSGGEQQRVAIARSIVNSPAILWADEPTGNLDTQTALKVIELLLQVNSRTGQTVVMVTHDPNVGKRSHRILRMDSGVMLAEETGELAAGPAA
ncbi:MAG TPA: ABC transporter ATP-binding protein [Thermoplasmata archaeon]|nr:ABC transporter ATP-binding protein [Thermoplasmata archaeon]